MAFSKASPCLLMQRNINNLVLNYHHFKLEAIIKECVLRIINSGLVLEDNNRETHESSQAPFSAYDVHYANDVAR